MKENVERLLARLAALHARRDVQAEAAQAFSEPVHVGAAWSKGADHALAALEHRPRPFPAEHAQCAIDLAQLRRHLRENVLAAVAARIGVERLLDLLQVGEDLAGHSRAKLQRADVLRELRTQPSGRRAG